MISADLNLNNVVYSRESTDQIGTFGAV